jgi:hypothetical protein
MTSLPLPPADAVVSAATSELESATAASVSDADEDAEPESELLLPQATSDAAMATVSKMLSCFFIPKIPSFVIIHAFDAVKSIYNSLLLYISFVKLLCIYSSILDMFFR